MGLFQKSLMGIKISYESLEKLEGKIGETPFFKVQPGKINNSVLSIQT